MRYTLDIPNNTTVSCPQLQSLIQFLEMNQCDKGEFFELVHNTLLQFVLEQICILMSKDHSYYLQVKQYYFKESNNLVAAKLTAKQLCGITLPDSDAEWLDLCLHAYFTKKPRRLPVSNETKQQLLHKQHFHCACCGVPITISDCYDHKIPWDLVGDELPNNGQMLCKSCNLSKSSKVYFEFQHKLITACAPKWHN